MKDNFNLIFCKTPAQAQLFAKRYATGKETYFWVIKERDLFSFALTPAKKLSKNRPFLIPKLKIKKNIRHFIFHGAPKGFKRVPSFKLKALLSQVDKIVYASDFDGA